jgi:DNA polymerase
VASFAHNLFFDTEVKAPHKNALDNLGLDVYSRLPGTKVTLASYAIDDGPETVIDRYHGEQYPLDFVYAWHNPDVRIVAHNAQYDRVVMMNSEKMTAPRERWYCTAARARIHGLPGDLEKLSSIFGLGDDAKKDGKRLIELFCEQGANPDDHIADWILFQEYSSFDITALRQLFKRLPDWSFGEFEQRYYHLNQKICDKGFKVDLPLGLRIIEASEMANSSLNGKVNALTAAEIKKGTQAKKIKAWLNSLSVHEFEDMRAETLRKAVRDHMAGAIELSEGQLSMIDLRLLSAKSSVSKCKTALNQAGPGSRIRYAITYAGGGRIGRNSHKGFQPGNMPRPTRKKDEIAAAIEALQFGASTMYSIWGDQSLELGANCLRGLIVAEEGHKLAVADWSNIEGRWLAWLANEEWKTQAYRDKDAGIGEDGYKLLFHRMTGTPLDEIDDFLRQQGKGVDLSMGYEGGVGAFLNIANSYQLDLVAIAKAAPRTLKPEFMERAQDSWEWANKHGATHGLPKFIYVACAALRDSYRAANPNIKSLWGNLLDCAKLAVQTPGQLFVTAGGKVKMACSKDRGWLAMALPTGRTVMFCKPKIEMTRRIVRDEDGDPIIDPETGLPMEEGKPRVTLTALKAPVWQRRPLYGGLIANAATQGGCRDILVNGELIVDEAVTPLGGDIILDIHDEIITELPDEAAYTHEDQIRLMTVELKRRLPQLIDLPLAAAGATLKRYRKL